MNRIGTTDFRATLILAGFSLIFGLAEARAGFTVALDSTSLDNSNELTTFHYTLATTAFDTITAGDSFTLNNFAGYVNGTITAPGNWELETTVNPANTSDSNLTFTFLGTSPIAGPVTLSGFSAVSQLAGVTLGTFDGSVTSSTGLTIPTSDGQVYLPGSGTISPIPAPEPSSLVLGGLGIVALALKSAQRRRSRQA